MEQHLNAAKGWLDLGDHAEAERELEQIVPKLRLHPDVLEVRWRIYAQQKMWTAAFEIAKAISELAPDRAFGWIHQAYSLHAQGRTAQAYGLLSKMAARFPALVAFPYSLACYACELKHPEEAWTWFNRALEQGDAKLITEAALNEVLLAPIWDRIRRRPKPKRAVWLPEGTAQRSGIRSPRTRTRLRSLKTSRWRA